MDNGAKPESQLQTTLDAVMPPVSLTIGGMPAPVSLCGPALGLPPGVFEVSATVPSDGAAANSLPVSIQVGSNVSLPIITISVK
jgi:uncharacterized protein (TIGR03437 family)